MLQTPFIMKEKFCTIDKLYENQNEYYVKVYLNVKQGYHFETHCDDQILMHGHEIQTLRMFNEILIDDYNLN